MAVSSLTKFTVPVASDQSANSQGLLMPKLKYRFRVVFENFGVSTPRTELTKQVMTFDRPNVSFEDIMLDVYNSRIRLAGKHTWEEVNCEIRDDVNGAVSKLVGEQLQKQFDFMEQASAASGIDYKFVTRFEVLDGANGETAPNILETWEMYGCYLATANYNNFDYSANDPATITLTIRYDNAVQTPLGNGVGAEVARTVGSVATG